MKRIFLISLWLLAACGSIAVAPQGEILEREKLEFKEVKIEEKSYYFRYPSTAPIDHEYITYQDCKVHFGVGWGVYFKEEPDLTVEKKKDGGKTYEAWYRNDVMIAYAGTDDSTGYVFWYRDNEKGAYHCVELIDRLTESFTDELGYVNEKFGFRVVLPSDYKVEYLNDGVVLKKWFEPDPEAVAHTEAEEAHYGYKVEIVFLPFENFEHFPSVAEYIAQEYPGYSIEFADYGGFAGYYVDEGSGNEAIRHFFSLSDDKSVIYEAYMKVPSFHYGAHKEAFDELVMSMEIL